MRKVLFVSTMVAVGLSTSVIAIAGSAENTSSSPAAVAGTAAGMPITAQVLYAVVDADGTKNRSLPNSVTAARLGTGTYEVIFPNRNIRACAYEATIGLSASSGASAPGEITVVGRATTTAGVFLQTYDSAGALADRGFHLTVNC